MNNKWILDIQYSPCAYFLAEMEYTSSVSCKMFLMHLEIEKGSRGGINNLNQALDRDRKEYNRNLKCGKGAPYFQGGNNRPDKINT